jgi:hypothetical protein
VPTRANAQPAFGVYSPVAQTEIARPYPLLVLTLEGTPISAIAWFGASSVFPQLGLPADAAMVKAVPCQDLPFSRRGAQHHHHRRPAARGRRERAR